MDTMPVRFPDERVVGEAGRESRVTNTRWAFAGKHLNNEQQSNMKGDRLARSLSTV